MINVNPTNADYVRVLEKTNSYLFEGKDWRPVRAGIRQHSVRPIGCQARLGTRL